MPNKAFQSMLETLAAQIDILNKNGYKLYDIENPDHYISGIEYDGKSDKLFIKFEEDKELDKREAV